jgi:uncharacterized protein (UPF0548 family)
VDQLRYAEVGATEFDELPAGYRHVRRRVRLGTGERVFTAVGRAVLTFGLQRRAGLRPVASAQRAAVGVVVTGRFVVVPLPCRVVWVHQDERSVGFGYGTLPGHPEVGEEAFVLSRDAADDVWLDIRAFSRPQRWFVRLAGPVGHLLQDLVTARYVGAARAFASELDRTDVR